jgi:hypothetical protein
MDWLARYEALSARDRNYRSAMYADLFARALSAVPAALMAAHEAGKDTAAFEIGALIRDLINRGATDTEIVDAVQAAVIGRLEAGLPLPEWFA